MALPLYLAQTPTEMAGNPLSENMAYMACHFSSCADRLSNLPEALPAGGILILDDSTPMAGHDPENILRQLSGQRWGGVLLDFQRQNIPGQRELAEILVSSLPCPVGVSEWYAQGLSCPVFLSPVPPDRPLSRHLAPWQGREIWLEVALDGITLTLTEEGCAAAPLFGLPEGGFRDDRLFCHYDIDAAAGSAAFRLWRTRRDLDALLSEAEALGVTKAVGLWQELMA